MSARHRVTMGFFELITLASITVASLGAVHGALARQQGPRALASSFLVVAMGGATAMLGIVPVLLALSTFPATLGWRLASAFGLLVVICGLAVSLAIHRRLTTLGYPPWPRAARLLGIGGPLLAAILLAANLAGGAIGPGPLPYGAALLSLLATAFLPLVLASLLPLLDTLAAKPDR